MSGSGPPALGRVAIVGAGQVGTMLGMALMANREEAGLASITLFDLDQRVAAASLALGAGDAVGRDIGEAFHADVVVLAVPVPAIVRLVDDFGPSASPGALVIDSGSAKRAIVDAMRRSVPPHAHAVGGHPMAGTERPGPNGADPGRLAGAAFVLSPVREDAEGLARGGAFVTAVGARAVVMDADAHDLAVALTSHLPHLLAFALADAAGGEGRAGEAPPADLVSTGFLGSTRLAQSDPITTAGFLSANAEAVGVAASRFRTAFDALIAALGDTQVLEAALAEGRRARRALSGEDAL
jgi:prephenate dehydrogenase